ncbi:hypothetical protein [Prosthecobacter sp.]|uniref:hypothetical protein n=1 Tax=Prosthecobacter sp. TaxID=1965333 RepID=UPI0037848E91
MPESSQKLYHAIVWREGPDQTGERVTAWASDLDEAARLLAEEYGKGNVYNLHNKEDAEKIR